MKVLLDEGVPHPLARELPGHDVSTVVEEDWASMTNGTLLGLIEANGFHVFLTNDKQMDNQQRLSGRLFAVIILSTNHWPAMHPHVKRIAQAIDSSRPGTVTKVDCGAFVPRRFRKPPGVPFR